MTSASEPLQSDISHIESLFNVIQLPSPKSLDQAQRIFHGRGHVYPSLEHICIDWLPPVILITLFKPESEHALGFLYQRLKECLPQATSIQLQERFLKNSPTRILAGEKLQQLIVKEGDLKFHVTLGKNQNCGFFLDMQTGRDWLRQNSKNKKILNLFAYTCSLSVAAIAAGAESVLNVDMSRSMLSIGRMNHQLNQQSLNSVSFEKLNIMKSFGRIQKKGPFDIVICDPPSNQPGSFEIDRDYPKLLRRLARFLKQDGIAMLCLNAPVVNQQSGHEFILDGMQKYAEDFKLIGELEPPEVFYDVQKKGLKILLFSKKY